MQNVTVGMVAPAFIYFPVWVAQQRGFFQARDIACSIAVAGTTDGVTNALTSGDTQFAMVTPEGVVRDALKGGPLRLVAGNANKAPLSLIGQKGLTAVEDLHGKRVGTTSLKEGTAVILQKILGVHGLHYLGDYEFAMVGAHPQRWEKLQQGEIEAGLQLLPYDYMAEDAGYPNLGEVATYVPDYAFTAIAFNTAWSEPNRALATAVLSALQEAVSWTEKNRDEGAAILAEANHSTLDYAKRGLKELFASGAAPRDLRIARPALEAMFDVMREVELVPKDAKLAYEMCVDDSYLDAAMAGSAR